MLTITPSCTFLKYGNVTISIPHDTIITNLDLDRVSIRVHHLYKSLRTLVENYAIFLGKITIDYGKLPLESDAFDYVHKCALESEFIANAQDSLIKKAFDNLHKVYKEFRMYLSDKEYFCERYIENYFATKDFYENCMSRKKAMLNANAQGVDRTYSNYEFDCTIPEFN
jgi:hypothetical protein